MNDYESSLIKQNAFASKYLKNIYVNKITVISCQLSLRDC